MVLARSGVNVVQLEFAPTLRLMIFFALLFLVSVCTAGETPSRPRAREAGVQVGVIAPGPLNAITDVAGVLVGQTTIIRADNIRKIGRAHV